MERRKLTPRVGMIAALLAVMVLAACDTQPATDVTTDAATLNGKGGCVAGTSGTYQYQLRDYAGGGGFFDVGPRYTFACSSNTGEVALSSHRVGGLKPANGYDFRLVSRLDNGTVQTWDSNGTNGGGIYDGFVTTGASVAPVEEYPAEQFVSSDPDGVPIASGCAIKEIKNIRKGIMEGGAHVWTLTLRTMWKYCSNGQITKMYPAAVECNITAAGGIAGWRCDGTTKIRVVSYGGNPEHAEYTYSWKLGQYIGFKGVSVNVNNIKWCASNAISGSGAHRRTGSCEITQW